MENKRPNWEEFWFTLALLYSTRSTCDRLRTACLLVDKDNRIISAGYNGSLPGGDHCDDAGHFMVDNHCLRTIHAEDNALLNSMRDLKGATAYILDTPCIVCAKKLISSGIKRILFAREFKNIGGESSGRQFVEAIAQKSGVEFRKVDIELKNTLEGVLNVVREKGGHFFDKNTENKDSRQVLRVERINPFAKLPMRAHEDDAGLDLFSVDETVIMPKQQVTVGTGIKLAIPKGHAGFVWDKSGIAAKHNIKTLGGVLDSNYRGELKVIMHNLGISPYEIRRGEKVAQLVIKPILNPDIIEERIEEETDRGDGGFGSTGLF